MKIDGINLNEDKILEIKAEQQKEYKYIGSQLKVPGHTMFSFNLKTKDLTVAKIEKSCEISLANPRGVVKKTKLCIEPDCIYIQALNKKNAIKKLIRKFNVK